MRKVWKVCRGIDWLGRVSALVFLYGLCTIHMRIWYCRFIPCVFCIHVESMYDMICTEEG